MSSALTGQLGFRTDSIIDQHIFVLDKYNNVFPNFEGFPIRNNESDVEFIITEKQLVMFEIIEIIGTDNDIKGDEKIQAIVSVGNESFTSTFKPNYLGFILSTYWDHWKEVISNHVDQLILRFGIYDLFNINTTGDEFIFQAELNSSRQRHGDHSIVSEVLFREIRFNLDDGILNRDFYYYSQTINSSKSFSSSSAFYVLRNLEFDIKTPLPLKFENYLESSDRNILSSIPAHILVLISFEILLMILIIKKNPRNVLV
ncbi:MAG: hypothetical protein ACXAC2_25430 [Candidatus Kariarchaeaceae archaeon]|jgi:hypothetical protein